jgi:uncharacterized protein YqjF (DUF2071 family)
MSENPHIAMGKIRDILKQVSHRPWDIPKTDWKYYQEWNQVLFFHWEIPAQTLLPLIPKGIGLDLFEGKAYISLVPFTMQKISPKYLPPFAPISDFHEVNLRTYVINDGKPGVFFISIEAQKRISAFLSRRISGLPYETSVIRREKGKYSSSNLMKDFLLEIEYAVKESIEAKSTLEKWLTERYALFLEDNGKVYRYDIHHLEWKIRAIEVKKLKTNYTLPGLDLSYKKPDLVHYSDGIEVIAWQRVRVL